MRHLEDAEAIALIQWRDLHVRKHHELELLIHIPQGGKRGILEATRFKKMGVRAGVSDYFLPVPQLKRLSPADSFTLKHGLWIELKAGKGRLSEEQAKWLDLMDSQGYAIYEARGWQDAARAISRYLRIDGIAP
jgi:hypothetical protein